MTHTFYRFDPRAEHVTWKGQALTSELVDALADEAEATGPPKGLVPGGKSLSGNGRHSPKIQVVLSEHTHARLRERARDEHMSVSKWVRRLIECELA